MSSVTSCILGKAASGLIDKEFAEKNVKKIEAYEKQLNEASPDTPRFKREQQLVHFANRLKEKADIKMLQLARDVEAKQRLNSFIAGHPKGKAEGLMSTMTYDLGGYSHGLNIDKHAEGIRALAFSDMGDVVSRLSLKWLGFKQDKKLAAETVRAIFGSSKDETAVKMAGQWKKTTDMLHARFKAAGGDMGDLKDWYLPQNHDSRLLNQVSEQEWVDFIKPLLDRDKMFDFNTGFRLSGENLDKVLRESYETLRTNGLNKLQPGSRGNAKLADKYGEQHRVLFFKDADSWIKYNERFGNNDIYKTMVEYIDEMSHDISMLEIYGANPDGMKKVITDEIKKEAGILRGEKERRKLNDQLYRAETIWNDVTRANTPVNPRAAFIGSEIRSWLTASQLGSAFLTQFSDVMSNTLTAYFNGLKMTDLWKNYYKLMFGNKARDFSIHLGLGAEELAKTFSSSARYAEGLLDKGFAGRVSEVVMRASLLNRMTMASKKAFMLDFSKTLADNSGLEFAKLDSRLQRAFKHYGIDEKTWNIIRKSKFDDFKGAKYLNLNTLAKEDLEAANKVQNMMFTERDFAVIDANTRTRSFLLGQSKAGTKSGEARRFFAMYKTFPLTMLTHHLSRMMSYDKATSRAGYFVGLFVPMTIAGAFTVQAKNFVNGKNPQPMNNWKFWISAAAAGGAAGILGDFLFSNESRTGNSFIMNLAGPGASALEDAYKVTLGAAKRKISGDDFDYTSTAAKTLSRYVPGNNLWLTRAGFERLLVDSATKIFDPKAATSFRRQEKKLKDEYGTTYWWRPGAIKPDKPNFSE